jgi:uncharacterized lipoprotein YddW (UPF0748 family)
LIKLFLVLVALVFVTQSAAQAPRGEFLEFRAAWVATVANIDWPSRPGLSESELKKETVDIIHRARLIGLNTLILQVRPVADSIYPSALEPWSEYLSGTQGKAPASTTYDPLQFWIDEANKAGIKIHAWFNPYRAAHPSEKSEKALNHVSRTLPEAVKSYGRYLWMDPSNQTAMRHSLAVILDVVNRYDIAGVHVDDYFYPYPEAADPAAYAQALLAGANLPELLKGTNDLDFPDEQNWQIYLTGGGQLSRSDWRRENVNRFIETLYRTVKKAKPHVLVGISPFGIGKPTLRPANIKGFSQFDLLYADVELWLQSGWLDYLAPQLYWTINSTNQAFETLLNYWASQNPHNKKIYAGLFTSRHSAQEIENQLHLVNRAAQANPLLNGYIHFSMKPILQNRDGISDRLQALQLDQAR